MTLYECLLILKILYKNKYSSDSLSLSFHSLLSFFSSLGMNCDHIMQLIEVAGSDYIFRDHNINVADIPPLHSSDLLILTALMALKKFSHKSYQNA